MAENYALWRVQNGFTDKYTKHRYKSGEVAVFSRERANEIMTKLGKNSIIEVDMPEGVHLTADGEVEQTEEVTDENAATEKTAEKPATRRGKGGKK